MAHVRRFRRGDGPTLWTLNNLPNVGSTTDTSLPLALPRAALPPPEFPDLANIEESFIAAGGDFFVAEQNGHLVGMAGLRGNAKGQAEVLRVRVHPAVRRFGIGRALMEAVEHRAAQLGYQETFLDTATNQPDAVAFYDALGYREVGRESRPDWRWTLVYFAKQLPR
jgi:N-acetylglutamate synthase-like GNAT family acetyltransferase